MIWTFATTDSNTSFLSKSRYSFKKILVISNVLKNIKYDIEIPIAIEGQLSYLPDYD